MKTKTGVLLVNLGTPSSPTLRSVHRYLVEFLTDPRVIDLSWFKRQLLVRALIVPTRLSASTRSYKQIWTEQGSPLEVYTRSVADKLQQRLGDGFAVEYAMRYPAASCKKALGHLLKSPLNKLILLPLFPQYASATTGSVFEHLFCLLSQEPTLPDIECVSSFYDHPSFIKACADQAKNFDLEDYDRILFSFHGLPIRQLIKADKSGQCGKENCCIKASVHESPCYSAQCYTTARLIAQQLELPEKKWEVAFQSRLGKDPWLTPFTSERLKELGQSGCKKVAVFCPSFVCDCLETLFEIGIEYEHLFKQAGGEQLQLIPGLNDSEEWIEALSEIVLRKSAREIMLKQEVFL